MNSFVINDSPFGGSHTKVTVEGNNAAELRKSFEQAMKQIRPEPNRIQKALYGEAHLNSLPDATIRKIVQEKRGMGNTTVQALKQIVDALQNPGSAVQLQRDHPHDNHAANRDYIEQHILPTIECLGLKFLVVDKLKQTLKFDV